MLLAGEERMAWANSDQRKGACRRKSGGDASRAMIGVAHISLRFAAGKMSGEETKNKQTSGVGCLPQC